MTIRNPDGTPYSLSGCFKLFDPGNPEHDLFNQWDAETINISGSPIYYYEVHIQTSNTVDEMYWEDRGKLFSPIPIRLQANYDPVTQQNYQSMYGIDSPDELIFELNYDAVLTAVGHPPKVGSRIYTPHKRENWIIVQRKVSETKLWGEIRLQLVCERFQESSTTGEGEVTQQKPDFEIN